MKKILSFLVILMFIAGNVMATTGWRLAIPALGENPQAISPDVIENNTAIDLMLQNYRDPYVTITLVSTSEIDVGPGGVMIQNAGGSTRLMVANAALTAVSSTNIDTGSISPSSTYYLYAYASSITATTFSVIFSASSTTPTGITYYHRLGSFTTDGSSNFSTVLRDGDAKAVVTLPSGSVFFMITGSCPSGTTNVSATYSNKFIKINATAGTSSAGVFTATTDSHTLTTAEVPALTTTFPIAGGAGSAYTLLQNQSSGTTTINTNGGGGGHSHTISSATTNEPSSISMILCQVT